ncbi:hypothetical protein [Endozoicomonas lisbonensis]|uniref:Uncharacterized protein n=1 Tax=Endozoicomonas lisbonensis TaxID=3120522 RepID=A0ABV2SCX3_9GAMM
MNEKQIEELRALKGQGMESAVGEYTPAELWEALDEIERLQRLTAKLLECFGAMEGTWYESEWSDFGITEEESKQLRAFYSKYTSST